MTGGGRFACPDCRRVYEVDGECEGCRAALVRAVALSADEVRVPLRSGFAALAVLFAAIGIPALIAAIMIALEERWSGAGPEGVIVPTAIFTALSAAAMWWNWRASDPNRSARRAHGAAKERRKLRERRLPLVRVEALPPQAHEPVRVRGRVRVEDGPDGRPRLAIVDGDRRCYVRVDDKVRAWCDAGAADALAEGDEVEIVGRGSRRIAADKGYRDGAGDFAFEDEVEVVVMPATRRAP